MFQEFPKALSKGDDWIVVFNSQEESNRRADGYKFARDEEDTPEPKRKPGRPPKAKE